MGKRFMFDWFLSKVLKTPRNSKIAYLYLYRASQKLYRTYPQAFTRNVSRETVLVENKSMLHGS